MSEFDWVTARSTCSADEVFEKLRVQVKQDVETRHALRPQGEPLAFHFISEGRTFSALVEGDKIHRAVIFRLESQTITVYTDSDDVLFRAQVTLNDEGECVVKINDEERQLWQMRKQGLEELFFTEYIRKPK